MTEKGKAEQALRSGQVDDALSHLKAAVRADPADPALRIFLFQLLSIQGDWDRAMQQLGVIEGLDDSAIAMVRAYQDALNCEKHRTAVFDGKLRPLVMGEPEPWIARLIEAQQTLAKGDVEQFETLNAQALEEAPATAGRLNGEPFAWLADADRRFGPVLEMVFNQHYYWVPMNRIQKLTTEEPADLRDLVWLPAEVTWTNGGQVAAMLPVRYPGISEADGQQRMAMHTDWTSLAEGIEIGVGQRLLATEESDFPLLQVRSIEFDR